MIPEPSGPARDGATGGAPNGAPGPTSGPASGDETTAAAPGEPEALDTARRFVDAVAWGEHRTVWDLLGREGRATVLRIAVNRGMSEALSARLRDGTTSQGEEHEFLTDLVNGLRADLAGTDLDSLIFDIEPGPVEPERLHVMLSSPVHANLGVAGLPVGTIELVELDGRWAVERLLPRAKR